MIEKIECIYPRGFCFGVERALKMLDNALPFKPYVLHEIVHNSQIIESYRQKGVRFVESLEDIPDGHVVLFSAHGVGLANYTRAKQKNLTVIDTTCPFVTRVHKKVKEFESAGKAVILIGKKDHIEMQGTCGHLKKTTPFFVIQSKEQINSLPLLPAVGVATQTTLCASETCDILSTLKKKYPHIELCDNVCQATFERQNAVLKACAWADIILVVGDKKSSNANRLVEVAQNANKKSYLIETVSDLKELNLSGSIAITSAASAPESQTQTVFTYLQSKNRLRP